MRYVTKFLLLFLFQYFNDRPFLDMLQQLHIIRQKSDIIHFISVLMLLLRTVLCNAILNEKLFH